MVPALNDWLGVLQDALAGSVETVPDGWHTAREIGRQTGRSPTAVNRMLRAGLETAPPCFEVRKFRIDTGARGIYPTPHYRMLPK